MVDSKLANSCPAGNGTMSLDQHVICLSGDVKGCGYFILSCPQ